ncbi:cytosolic Fe-S cluster assembly factor NUBP1-like [Dysidea avara]|uniref:cytosolic Fe-S cluster assembly factor NUBP1-like n=1 Tax=Dysidea avara TaxID=196820 RepID=UPI003331A6E4
MEKDEHSENVAAVVGCPSETKLAGKANICQGCPGRDLCLSGGGVDPDQEFIDVRMNAIKHKILILSGKGGVGKSSIATCLATALANCGKKVGIADLDICGPSVPKMMGVEGQKVVNSDYGWVPLRSPNHDIKVMSVGTLLEDIDSAVVWRGPRKTALIKRFIKDTFWGRLDYLIFDTPPGTSDEHLSIIKILTNARPDGAVIVTTPQEVAVATVRKEINFCKKMNLKVIGLIENMSSYCCPCCKESWPVFPTGRVDSLVSDLQIPVLGKIPLYSGITQSAERGSNVLLDEPSCTSTELFFDIAKRITDM